MQIKSLIKYARNEPIYFIKIAELSSQKILETEINYNTRFKTRALR